MIGGGGKEGREREQGKGEWGKGSQLLQAKISMRFDFIAISMT